MTLVKNYAELSKMRISLFVALTTAMSFYLAGGQANAAMFLLLTGVILASMSTGSLNQYLERKLDSLMQRTKSRPLPQGRIQASKALLFGSGCGVLGVMITLASTNILSAVLTAATIVIYIFLYTPLKKITPQSTWIGCCSGAMPALIGWAAARGELSPAAWSLFAVQFLWQIPHFLSIFWLHRDDYKAAGFRVLPVLDPTGGATGIQIAIHALALLLASSILPLATGLNGVFYGAGATILGGAFLVMSLRASWYLDIRRARQLFIGSLVYLPLLYSLMIIDQIII
ncbi:MAG: protoheme IX farnesyltransferase [Elusimicrobia bacterium]|nr:protoheme IX farnesyltransferase [Elusimicrobiota bacterium]